LLIFFYGALATQVIFSLNYDVLMAFATSRSPEEELEFGKSAMKFGVQWFLMYITGAPILINSGFVMFSGVQALASILSQL